MSVGYQKVNGFISYKETKITRTASKKGWVRTAL